MLQTRYKTMILKLVSIAYTLNLLVVLTQAAPTSTSAEIATSEISPKILAAANVELGRKIHQVGPANPVAAESSSAIPDDHAPTKLKRDARAKVTSLELDTQETGYLPSAYDQIDSDHGYDAGKNSYGKQASDWSLYDQGKWL